VFNASGARNFFGEGFPFHKAWRLLGMTWENTTFISKTTTLEPRKGNMPLKDDGVTPKQFKPSCIVVNFRKGLVLNAVGLSGPGANCLFERGEWQRWPKPLLLSFMAVSATKEERLEELDHFVSLFKRYLPFASPVGLQINYSCPNVGLHLDDLYNEIGLGFDLADQLRIPLIAKFNPTIPASLVIDIARFKICDAVSLTNTVPWGQCADKIPWEKLFGRETSPLAHLGGGGLSGPPVLPIVINLIKQCIEGGIAKPIMGGNGVQSGADAQAVINAGASGIELGIIGIVRPQRMRETIECANKMLGVKG